MKLIIQIPCKDEEQTLPIVINSLPSKLPGIDIIEYQVIDDGSTDDTFAVAKKMGVHHLVRFSKNRGLGFAFKEGTNSALQNGADILVNLDADNQYPSEYISKLIEPILKGSADIVVGNRCPGKVKHFSWIKKKLQIVGNSCVSSLAGEKIPDAVSGFRAYSRDALLELNITSRFSYVLDTLIQAYKKGLKIEWITIKTNSPTRPSRLFGNMFHYIKRSSADILRVYAMYEPLKMLLYLSVPFLILGFIGIFRFLYFYVALGTGTGKIQSLIISAILIQIGFVFISLAIIGDLISKNRSLSEDNLKILKKIKYEK